VAPRSYPSPLPSVPSRRNFFFVLPFTQSNPLLPLLFDGFYSFIPTDFFKVNPSPPSQGIPWIPPYFFSRSLAHVFNQVTLFLFPVIHSLRMSEWLPLVSLKLFFPWSLWRDHSHFSPRFTHVSLPRPKLSTLTSFLIDKSPAPLNLLFSQLLPILSPPFSHLLPLRTRL